MKIMKLIILILFCFSGSMLFGVDLQKVDQLDKDGKYEDALKLLKEGFDSAKPDAAVLWRMSRENYELADLIPLKNKKEKISKFTEGMDIVKPYFGITAGEKIDRAKLFHFYAINLGARGKVIGIKESLDIIPDLYFYASKSLELEPAFSGPYILVAEIDAALCPYLVMGGDYYRMGINYMKALQYESDNLTFYYNAAAGLSARNWDVSKKKSETDKWNSRKESISDSFNKNKKMPDADRKKLLKDYEVKCVNDGTPENKSDKEFSIELLNKLVKLYEDKKDHSARDNLQYKNGVALLKKLKG
jgi:hypothetical protein